MHIYRVSYVHTEHHSNLITLHKYLMICDSLHISHAFPPALYQCERDSIDDCLNLCLAITRDGGKERVWEGEASITPHHSCKKASVASF